LRRVTSDRPLQQRRRPGWRADPTARPRRGGAQRQPSLAVAVDTRRPPHHTQACLTRPSGCCAPRSSTGRGWTRTRAGGCVAAGRGAARRSCGEGGRAGGGARWRLTLPGSGLAVGRRAGDSRPLQLANAQHGSLPHCALLPLAHTCGYPVSTLLARWLILYRLQASGNNTGSTSTGRQPIVKGSNRPPLGAPATRGASRRPFGSAPRSGRLAAARAGGFGPVPPGRQGTLRIHAKAQATARNCMGGL
jgi:hypothetical protein